MTNELFAVWHPPAPVASGLDTIRSVLVAIENGRPIDGHRARSIHRYLHSPRGAPCSG